MTALRTMEEPEVARRVDADNEAALALYGSLGFRPWAPDTLS